MTLEEGWKFGIAWEEDPSLQIRGRIDSRLVVTNSTESTITGKVVSPLGPTLHNYNGESRLMAIFGYDSGEESKPALYPLQKGTFVIEIPEEHRGADYVRLWVNSNVFALKSSPAPVNGTTTVAAKPLINETRIETTVNLENQQVTKSISTLSTQETTTKTNVTNTDTVITTVLSNTTTTKVTKTMTPLPTTADYVAPPASEFTVAGITGSSTSNSTGSSGVKTTATTVKSVATNSTHIIETVTETTMELKDTTSTRPVGYKEGHTTVWDNGPDSFRIKTYHLLSGSSSEIEVQQGNIFVHTSDSTLEHRLKKIVGQGS